MPRTNSDTDSAQARRIAFFRARRKLAPETKGIFGELRDVGLFADYLAENHAAGTCRKCGNVQRLARAE